MASSATAPDEVDDSGSDKLVAGSLAVVALVFVGCFWPFLEGRHFLYGDLGNWGLPMRMFYADSIRAGESPLWSPHLFSGFYLHGEGQVGMFHPVHWLLYRWLPFGVAFAIECALPYPLALAGMLLFLRRLAIPLAAAVFGAAAFGFSTYLLVRYTHLNVPTILAHVPWLLWLADVSARDPAARTRAFAWVGIALATASQVLLGYPGAVVFSVAYLGAYLLLLATELRTLRPLLACATASALGLLIGAVQLLPTLELFGMSQRAGALLSERTVQSLHPLNILQLVSPYLYAQRVYQVEVPNPIEQSFYLGALLPVALAWLLARRRSGVRHRRLLACLAALCGLSMWIALGRYAGLYEWIAAVPLIGQLRVPARYTLIFHLAAAIVLALAFADLLRGSDPAERRRAARWLWLAPAVSFGVTVVALLLAPAAVSPGRALSGAALALLGPALSLLGAAVWVAAVHGVRGALVGLVLFVAADQAFYGASLWWSVPPQTIAEFKASAPGVPDPTAGRVAMGFSDAIRVNEKGDVLFFTSTRAVLNDVHLVWGYASLMPERVLGPYTPKALEVAGAAYVRHNQGFARVPDPLPRFRLVSDVRRASDLPREIQEIDVRETALLEIDTEVEPGLPGRVRVEHERPGAIRLAVDAPARQLLVVAESFHPGWQFEVDGTPATTLRVYGDFMGTVIEGGSHEVELRFRPRSYALGLRLSALGLLGLVAAAVFGSRASGRNASRGREFA